MTSPNWDRVSKPQSTNRGLIRSSRCADSVESRTLVGRSYVNQDMSRCRGSRSVNKYKPMCSRRHESRCTCIIFVVYCGKLPGNSRICRLHLGVLKPRKQESVLPAVLPADTTCDMLVSKRSKHAAGSVATTTRERINQLTTFTTPKAKNWHHNGHQPTTTRLFSHSTPLTDVHQTHPLIIGHLIGRWKKRIPIHPGG